MRCEEDNGLSASGVQLSMTSKSMTNLRGCNVSSQATFHLWWFAVRCGLTRVHGNRTTIRHVYLVTTTATFLYQSRCCCKGALPTHSRMSSWPSLIPVVNGTSCDEKINELRGTVGTPEEGVSISSERGIPRSRKARAAHTVPEMPIEKYRKSQYMLMR